MTLTVNQLFNPAPSGVGPYGFVGGALVGQVPQVPGAGTWLSVMLDIAASVQLPTTSWQTGDPERTIFATEAVCFSLSDANISQMAQGGFLQSAASGTVTWTSPAGVTVVSPVTPDPSNAAQNPTGAPGYLDLLAANVYDVQRLQATSVTGPLAIVKMSAGTLTYAAGAYHVGSAGGASYHNAAALSVPSGAIAGTGGVVVGVTVGASTTVIMQSASGLATGQVVYLVLPPDSGVTFTGAGLNGPGVFATVTSAIGTAVVLALASSGTYTAGGNVYLCTVATMIADVAGIASNAGPGAVTTAITQNTNVFVSNLVPWFGSNFENNTSLAGRCQLSLAARSPNGPSGAYVYFADTAYQILAAATPAYLLTGGPVRATEFATPSTGVVNLVVGSATPSSTTLGANVTPGVAQLAISGVSNANPCVVTCVGPTTLAPGGTMTVTISGVLGVAGGALVGSINGTYLATYDGGANSFSIQIDTSGSSAYAGGGSVEGGDLGQIDRLIQQNVVPDNTTAITSSALALPIQVTATVVVPSAYVAAYQLAVVPQLQVQMAAYAFGGNSPDFAVAFDDIVGALQEAGVLALGQASYVRQIQNLTVNGAVVDVPFPTAFFEAVLVTPSISVVGV